MDANEMADKLEKPMLDNPECPNFSRTRAFMEQVVAMLRQQQAEIDTYKSQNDSQIDTYRYKELTDEEIKSEAKYFCNSWHSQNPERLVLFAKAILKKAQEKTIQSVMAENCTCYKLGYNPLNDYASVKAK